MEAILYKQPHSVSFTGNPIPFAFALSPYGVTERRSAIRLMIKLQVEVVWATGVYAEVRSQVFFPDRNGSFAFDVASLVDPYLEFYQPRPDLTTVQETPAQQKRFRIQWLLERDNVPITTIQTSAEYTAIKGGLSIEEWHPLEYFTALQPRLPLSWLPFDKVHHQDLRYFFFLGLSNANAQATVLAKDSAGNTHTRNLPLVATRVWGVYCVPVLPSVQAILATLAAGVLLTEIGFEVMAGPVTVVNRLWVTIDQRAYYETHVLLFRNSLGGLDTVRLRGQTDFEAEYTRTAATRVLPPSYYTSLNLNRSKITTATEEEKWKGDTGFLSKKSIDRLRDLLLSNEVYAYRSGKLIPVEIATKSAKFFGNRDNLQSLQLEWQNAHSNQSYTPSGTMPTSRTCPAVEKLEVRQVDKRTLQIIYAIPFPYNEVEVQFNFPGDFVTWRYDKGAGVVMQNFPNPAGASPVAVSVQARVVCNPNTTPQDLGPWTTVNFSVTGNSLPVATPDVFTIQRGFNSAVSLPTSVLANDYDPDGDALSVVPVVNGATSAGGSYSIDAAGIATYTPPSSSFSGVDSFPYTVQEQGGATVVSSVTINVGTVATTIYAKAVTRNTSTSSSGSWNYTWADIFLEFFADPAGTIPYDITGLGLNINFEKKAVGTGSFNGQTQTTNGSRAGNGTAVFLERISIVSVLPPMGPLLGGTITITFRTLPGSGYTAI